MELGEEAGMFVVAEGEADKIPKAVRRVAPRQSSRFGNTTSNHRKYSLAYLSFSSSIQATLDRRAKLSVSVHYDAIFFQ